jgi:uracil-DNA glycosylase
MGKQKKQYDKDEKGAYALKHQEEKDLRINLLNEPHITQLTKLVEDIRKKTGKGKDVPWIEPLDGGVQAKILFLLEAPGKMAVKSGFISRNNPDGTAKNFLRINNKVNIPRETTVTFNIVPWYLGNNNQTKIRPAGFDDILKGAQYLDKFIQMINQLEIVVLMGKPAEMAAILLSVKYPNLKIIRLPHPSPRYLNSHPEEEARMVEILKGLEI